MGITGEKAIIPFFGSRIFAFDLVGGSKNKCSSSLGKLVFFLFFPCVVDSGCGRLHHYSLRRAKSQGSHMFPFNFGSVLWDL